MGAVAGDLRAGHGGEAATELISFSLSLVFLFQENVQPLRKGRNATMLAAELQTTRSQAEIDEARLVSAEIYHFDTLSSQLEYWERERERNLHFDLPTSLVHWVLVGIREEAAGGCQL